MLLPTIFLSRQRTRTRTVVISDGRTHIAMLECCPICSSVALFKNPFPRTGLPTGDHVGFFHTEQTVLPLCLHVLVFGRVVVFSTVVGIVAQVIPAILELLTCALVRTPTATCATPAMPGSLEIVSRNLAAAIWEADALCTLRMRLCVRCRP